MLNLRKRETVDGHHFPSQLEADTYRMLSKWENEGKIINLQRQVRVEPPACEHCGERPARPVKVDFKCLVVQNFEDLKNGEELYVEAKGIVMREWRELVSWWKNNGPAKLRIYARRSARKNKPRQIKLQDEIIPTWMKEPK